MNQEPVLIKGVVAFPNPNGNREIRFIDAFYHDLFKIPDHSSIVINYLDGGKSCPGCSEKASGSTAHIGWPRSCFACRAGCCYAR